ncbi:MAG TPA: protein-disulfide isomerase [Rheinheimera sp.]|nr:protein-disulfide isomerase [Rheinheimera sp.]
MKRIFSLLLALMLAPAAWAVGGPYQEGVQYEVIGQQGTAKPELKEFFSFYCPHCNAFEPVLHEIAQKLPAGTAFKKYHVDFMGQAPQPIQQNLSEVMVLAKLKGKDESVNKALFKHIHTDKKRFGSTEEIKAVAVAAGLDAATFDKDIKSFAVQSQVRLMQKEQKTLSEAKIMNSVPTLIVNGRYKLHVDKLDAADIKGDLAALIQFLLTK